GGLGQRLTLGVRGPGAVHSCIYERIHHPAAGCLGGEPGRAGRVTLDDGTEPHPKKKYFLAPQRKVTLELPGGGGYGKLDDRSPKSRERDFQEGYTTE
ncbi:MAG: hydantoinase B/oxoprolinase family protein, partial [Planctomycetota bacterium]